jgi:hypothetical protein
VPYASVILSDSPLLHFRLGEGGSPSTVTDSSGNGYTGTVSGSPTFGVAGALAGDGNTAMQFDGSAYVTQEDVYGAFDAVSTATLEFWARKGGASRALQCGFVIGDTRFLIQWDTDGTAYFCAENGGPVFPYCVIADTAGWHHFVLAFDGSLASGSRIKAYIDGVPQTLTAAGTPPSDLSGSMGDFKIGVGTSGTRIDEVALYGSALSAARALAHYQAGVDAGAATNASAFLGFL